MDLYTCDTRVHVNIYIYIHIYICRVRRDGHTFIHVFIVYVYAHVYTHAYIYHHCQANKSLTQTVPVVRSLLYWVTMGEQFEHFVCSTCLQRLA